MKEQVYKDIFTWLENRIKIEPNNKNLKPKVFTVNKQINNRTVRSRIVKYV